MAHVNICHLSPPISMDSSFPSPHFCCATSQSQKSLSDIPVCRLLTQAQPCFISHYWQDQNGIFGVYRDLYENYNVTYSLENCLVPTLPLHLGWMFKNNPSPRKKSDILFYNGSNHNFLLIFLMTATFFFMLVHTVSSPLVCRMMMPQLFVAPCSATFGATYHVHVQALGMCNIFHAMVGCCWSREGMHKQGFPVGLLQLAKAKVH